MIRVIAWPAFAPLLLLFAMSASPEHVGYESEECNDPACSYRVGFAVEDPFFAGPRSKTTPAYERFIEALSDSEELFRCRTLYPLARGPVLMTAFLDRGASSKAWSVRMDAEDSLLTSLLAWPNRPVRSADLPFAACMKSETERMLQQHPVDLEMPYRPASPDYRVQYVP